MLNPALIAGFRTPMFLAPFFIRRIEALVEVL